MRDYRSILSQELKKRKDKNPSYSLRAFARDIGLSASRLSEILNFKQGLSAAKAKSIAQNLHFDPNKEKWFTGLVEAQHARGKRQRKTAEQVVIGEERRMAQRLIDEEVEILSNWYSFAIRRLTLLDDFKGTPLWISRRLNITEEEAKKALQALAKAGHFSFNKKGEYLLNHNVVVKPTSPKGDKHVKKIYKEILEKAYQGRFDVAHEFRDNAIHIFALNKNKIAKIKRIIRDSEDLLDAETYNDNEADTIYCFTTHLFPISTLDPGEI